MRSFDKIHQLSCLSMRVFKVYSFCSHEQNCIPLLYSSTSSCGLVSSRAIALTTSTVSVSMSLSSAATNGLATLRDIEKSPIRRLGIRALLCDQQVHTTDQGPLLRYDLPCFNLQKICISTHRTKYSLPYLFPFCQGI